MATEQQKSDFLDALTDAQIASGATQSAFAAYLGALVAAAHTADLNPSDVGAIVSIGGITTKISAINAQIERQQDEFDEHRSEHQTAISALTAQKEALQTQLKVVVGGS